MSLANVFFEFSLLEGIGWEKAVRQGATIELMRGVWLRRSGATLEAAIVHQDAPGGVVRRTDFFTLSYDSSLRRIMVSFTKAGQKAVPIDTQGRFAKPFIIALMLLRHLSPALKCQPTPSLVLNRSKILVGCAHDAARLYRVHPSPPNPDWFVLRDAGKPEEPFTDATQRAGLLTFETRLPFRDVPLAQLRKAIAG